MKLHNGIFASSLAPAVTFGIIQSVTVYFWVRDANGAGWEHMVWMVGGLTFLLGWLLWKLFARKPGGMSARRGATVGFMTGVLVSPIFWLVFAPLLVVLNSWDHMTIGDMPTVLNGLAWMSLFTLLFAGLPPLILCTLAGCFWGRTQV